MMKYYDFVSQHAVNLFLEPLRSVRQWMSENGTESVLSMYTVNVDNKCGFEHQICICNKKYSSEAQICICVQK